MKVHFEPYLFLAALTHESALVAWGGFYFKVARDEGRWKLVDDSDLDTGPDGAPAEAAAAIARG
jgi:hypothetical protein